MVKLIDFFIRDKVGCRLDTILTGETVDFCFCLKCGPAEARNIDFGFNFFNADELNLSVLYSSYQNIHFQASANEMLMISCRIPHFPFTIGNYKIGTRITVNNEEADWLHGGAGFIQVENGNFFGTGNIGFSNPNMVNIKGDWKRESV
jgi:hypothetical protein